MIEAIGFMNTELEKLGINYEFDEWTSVPMPATYWVGEYNEAGESTDGANETTFILTGITIESRLTLEKQKDTIQQYFRERTAILDNGAGIAVSYLNAFPIQSVEGIKRIQINLTIKEWMVTE